MQQSMRPFFHGMDAKKRRTHKNQRCILCECNHHEICGGVSGGGRLGALFHNYQDGIIFRKTLADLGHPQPKTPVHCDNATAVGIANNTIKWQHSRSMEMRFFWVGDKEAQDMLALRWHPGAENLADYQSKHHVGSHHIAVRLWYLHTENSPRY